MSEDEILANMVYRLIIISGYRLEEAIEEVNDLYLTKLIYEPCLN